MLASSVRRCSLAALFGVLTLTAPIALDAQSAPAAVPASPALQGSALGQTVVLTWTAVPGATNYIAAVGAQSNVYPLIQSIGNTTTVSVQAPPGVYYIRVAAQNAQGISQPSNEVVLNVAPSTGAPPPAPANLTGHVSGQFTLLAWQLGQGGGPTTGLVFGVGSTPGANNLAVIPLNVSTSAAAAVPAGSYFARLYAVGPGGVSAPSNELSITVGPPECSAPTGPTATANVSGQTVTVGWGAVAGAANYRVDVSMTSGGPLVLSQMVGGATTSLSTSGAAPGTYFLKVTAINACGQQATGPEIQLQVTPPPPGTNRTPDPAPGQILPLPNMSSIVDEVARNYPNDLRNSCREQGGNNVWLFRLVQRLRQIDTRWGLNWKRANVGDMSQDVVDYHYGAGPDEGSYDTYVVDVIGGHCGSNPGPAFHDVTSLGTRGAIWTIRPLQ